MMALAAVLGVAPVGGDLAGKALKGVARDVAGEAAEKALKDWAQEMGFRTLMKLYHATPADQDFAAFRKPSHDPKSPYPGDHGVFTTLNPEDIDEFAAGGGARAKGNSPRALSLYYRAENPTRVDLTGKETQPEIATTLSDAWAQGKDAVMLRNYGKNGSAIIEVKDPEQLRSIFAQFDKSRRDSPELLAAIAAVPVTYERLEGSEAD